MQVKKNKRIEITERLELPYGPNIIKITAIDTDGILAEENITITREKDYVGVPNSNIFFPDQNATKTNSQRLLGTELKRKASREDTVVIFYAGHPLKLTMDLLF